MVLYAPAPNPMTPETLIGAPADKFSLTQYIALLHGEGPTPTPDCIHPTIATLLNALSHQPSAEAINDLIISRGLIPQIAHTGRYLNSPTVPTALLTTCVSWLSAITRADNLGPLEQRTYIKAVENRIEAWIGCPCTDHAEEIRAINTTHPNNITRPDMDHTLGYNDVVATLWEKISTCPATEQHPEGATIARDAFAASETHPSLVISPHVLRTAYAAHHVIPTLTISILASTGIFTTDVHNIVLLIEGVLATYAEITHSALPERDAENAGQWTQKMVTLQEQARTGILPNPTFEPLPPLTAPSTGNAISPILYLATALGKTTKNASLLDLCGTDVLPVLASLTGYVADKATPKNRELLWAIIPRLIGAYTTNPEPLSKMALWALNLLQPNIPENVAALADTLRAYETLSGITEAEVTAIRKQIEHLIHAAPGEHEDGVPHIIAYEMQSPEEAQHVMAVFMVAQIVEMCAHITAENDDCGCDTDELFSDVQHSLGHVLALACDTYDNPVVFLDDVLDVFQENHPVHLFDTFSRDDRDRIARAYTKNVLPFA